MPDENNLLAASMSEQRRDVSEFLTVVADILLPKIAKDIADEKDEDAITAVEEARRDTMRYAAKEIAHALVNIPQEANELREHLATSDRAKIESQLMRIL